MLSKSKAKNKQQAEHEAFSSIKRPSLEYEKSKVAE